MQPIVEHLIASLGIHRGPKTPPGVYARTVEGRTLYVNTENVPQTLMLPGPFHLTLSGADGHDKLELEPFEVELVEDRR